MLLEVPVHPATNSGAMLAVARTPPLTPSVSDSKSKTIVALQNAESIVS